MSIKVKVFTSIFWASVTTIGVRLINPLATFVLAGLLTPTDFGLVAIASLTLAIIQVVQDFGLGQALIRWKDDLNQAADVTFILVIVWSTTLYAILFFLASFIADFFNEPNATLVIKLLGITLLTSALGTVPSTMLEKKLDFKKKVLPEIVPLLVYVFISVALALTNWQVWSIVWARIAQSLITTILMWQVSGWRFKFSFDIQIAKKLLNYSKPLLATSFLTIVFLYLDNGFIGKILSTEALGFYAFAFNLANLPVTSLTFIVNRVSFPSFSQLQQQKKNLSKAFLYSERMLTLVIFPIISGQILLWPEILTFFYDDKWATSILPLQILSIYALFRTIGGLPTSILMTINKHRIIPKLIAIYVIVALLLLGPITYLGGIVGTSILMTSIISFSSIIWIVLANKYLAISVKLFWQNIFPQAISATLMFIFLWVAIQRTNHTLISLIFLIFFGSIIYLAAITLLTQGKAYREVQDVVKTMYFG